MQQHEFVLAVMSPARTRYFSMSQIQKLLYIVDRNISERIDAPRFDFEPWDFGPTCPSVSESLRQLEAEGYLEVVERGEYGARYRLWDEGVDAGAELLATFAEHNNRYTRYVADLVDWVLDMTFAQLMTAMWHNYPDIMRKAIFAPRDEPEIPRN